MCLVWQMHLVIMLHYVIMQSSVVVDGYLLLLWKVTKALHGVFSREACHTQLRHEI